MQSILRSSVVAMCMAVSSNALALPEFPDDLQEATGAPCPPHCTVCHADEGPSEENLTKPFGEAFEARGGAENMRKVVARMKAQGVDSDGDGAGDIDELAAGNDPNNAYDSRICGPEVGCSAAPSHEPTRTAWPLLTMFGGLLGLTWRRRRR